MTDKDKPWTVELGDQVKKQMADDPEIAEAIRDVAAQLRQAIEGVDQNDPDAIEKALRAMGMTPVTDIDDLVRIDTLEDGCDGTTH
jgi:hypothetical protein